jgi:hypothetical protein
LGTTDSFRPRAKLSEAVAELRTLAEVRRLPFHPAGRLQLAIDAVATLLETHASPPEQTAIASREHVQAVDDIYRMRFILKALEGNALWTPLLDQSFSGHHLPWNDRNSHARNTEFELYVAAVLAAAGYRPEPGEPDIRLRLKGWPLGVAIKRLSSSSPKAIERRLREGLEQIDRSGFAGMVALDITPVLLERRHFLEANSLDTVNRLVREKHVFIGDWLQLYRKVRLNPQLHMGILLISAFPVLLQEGRSLLNVSHMHRHWITNPRPGDPRHSEIDRLYCNVTTVTTY